MSVAQATQIVKGPWTKEEDERLAQLVAAFGPRRWNQVAERLGGRLGKQCRERWHNHLDPTVNKQPFSQQEELLIYQLHQKIGNKWAEIARYLPGRTDNSIKNHWNSCIQRKLCREQAYFERQLEERHQPATVNITATKISLPSINSLIVAIEDCYPQARAKFECEIYEAFSHFVEKIKESF